MLEPERRFYNDLPEDEQKHWVSELVNCPVNTQLTALTHTAYLYHPVTYLFCENDQAIPQALQEKMVGTVEDIYHIKINKEHCSAGHSPFLSQPKTLLDLVDKIVASKD